MKKIILLIAAVAFTFSGCETDDICDSDTTPLLVISFYDIDDPTELKDVTDLTIIGEGMTEGITYDDDTLINDSTVSIPLKTDADSASFSFILNYGSDTATSINQDEITFYYTRSSEYVSRACGFKTTYTLNSQTPFVHTDSDAADGKWITYIAVSTYDIDDEDETHVKIYF